MGRKSKIESHPDWRIIVKRLAAGEEYSNIIQDFPGLTWFDLDYYVKNKLPELLSKSPELKAEVESIQGTDTLTEVRALKTRAMGILDQAQKAGDLKTALIGIREARGCLETCLKAEGRIAAQPQINLQQVNIYQSPEWSKVGEILARVLAGYPELKSQVAGELLALARGTK